MRRIEIDISISDDESTFRSLFIDHTLALQIIETPKQFRKNMNIKYKVAEIPEEA